MSEKSKGWTKNLKLRVSRQSQAVLSSMGHSPTWVAEPGDGNRVRARLEVQYQHDAESPYRAKPLHHRAKASVQQTSEDWLEGTDGYRMG